MSKPQRIVAVDWRDEAKAIEEEVARLERRKDRLPRYIRHLKKSECHELICGRMSDIRRAVSNAEKRFDELEGEPLHEAAPLVRSLWQLDRPSEEDVVQDTPGSHRFGSAKFSDTPLSTGEAKRPNVVILKRAVEKHQAS